MIHKVVTQFTRHDSLQAFDLVVLKLDDPARRDIDQVVVMIFRHLFVARAAVAEIMPLDRKVTALSKNHCKIASGAVARDETCAQLRLLLLAEMAARAFKNVLRQYLRSAAFHTSAVVRRLQTYLVVQFFNIVTGAHARAEEFWREQLYHAIVLRYGPDAVSVVERQNVQLTLEPAIVYVLQRLQSMLGVRIQPATVAHFLDGPIGE